jgi:molybdate transport system substrate-binding protein
MSSPVRFMSALPIKGAFQEAIGPLLLSEGYAVSIDWLPTTLIQQKLKEQVRCDVVFALTDALEGMIADGTVIATSRRDVVLSYYGVAVQAGAPHPAIDTLDAFITSLKSARSVAFSRSGASGIYFAALLEKLGLDEEVRKRATIISSGLVAETLLTGEADLAIQQISELKSVAGIEIVGPFPEAAQQEISFSAGVTTNTADRDRSEHLVSTLADPRLREVYQRYGMKLIEQT